MKSIFSILFLTILISSAFASENSLNKIKVNTPSITSNTNISAKTIQTQPATNIKETNNEKKVSRSQINEELDRYYKLKKNNLSAAKSLLEKILKQEPQNADAQGEMGYLLMDEKNPTAALGHFLIAFKLKPTDKNIAKEISYISSGDAELDNYYNLKKINPKSARALLENIVAKHPNNEKVQTEFGYTLLQEKNYSKALEHFTIAIKLKPDSKTIIKEIAEIKQTIATQATTQKENDVNALMDKYYKLKKQNLSAAKALLAQILTKYPKAADAQAEMGYNLLNEKKTDEALKHFNIALQLKPNDKNIIKQIAEIKLSKIAPKSEKKLSKTDLLLDQFYKVQKTNSVLAEAILWEILYIAPSNVNAHKEMAYLMQKQKRKVEALNQFLIIEQLTPKDYEIKMEIAYLYDDLGKKCKAYHYFRKTTFTPDPKLKQKANKAMTDMGGAQTKILPDPWYAEVYLYPFYYSRFNLADYPLEFRIGHTFGKKQQLQVYLSNRTNYDNRSRGGAQLPSIFADDYSITSIGFKYTPFYNAIPGLQIYLEAGRAYSIIVPQDNNFHRWRNDLRGGLLFFQDWGAKPKYIPKFDFHFKHIGSFYSDITYYSRYHDNIIGYSHLIEGLRLLQYKTADIDAYLSVRHAFDTHHEFFNNIIEYGPGFRFIPNNRYGIDFTVEFLRGDYIKVDSPSPNPYSQHYHNTLSIAEFYFRF